MEKVFKAFYSLYCITSNLNDKFVRETMINKQIAHLLASIRILQKPLSLRLLSFHQ